jgi:hypothetical protein
MGQVRLVGMCLTVGALLGLGLGASEQPTEQAQLLHEIRMKWKGHITEDRNRPEAPVVGVTFGCSSEVEDSLLAWLKLLPHLQTIGVSSGKVTDAGLEHLKALKNLRRVMLYSPNITWKGLDQLQALPQLSYLEIGRARLSARGVESLEACRALKTLVLSRVILPRSVLQCLKDLRQLDSLHIHDSGLTDEDVRELKQALPGVKIEVSK